MSSSSSSKEELEQASSNGGDSKQKSVDGASISVPTVATVDSKAANHMMLKLVVEAVRLIPSKNLAKGISIQKIKEYLRVKHHMRKMEIKDQLRSALETAIKQKMLLKTTGRASVLIGSVKLNPALHAMQETESESSSEDSDSTDKEPTPETRPTDSKRRKAATESEKEGTTKKHRK